MAKVYNKSVGERNFTIKKDYFGNWSIYNADQNFQPVTGCPPFSIGHRTKREAMDFLGTFSD